MIPPGGSVGISVANSVGWLIPGRLVAWSVGDSVKIMSAGLAYQFIQSRQSGRSVRRYFLARFEPARENGGGEPQKARIRNDEPLFRSFSPSFVLFCFFSAID